MSKKDKPRGRRQALPKDRYFSRDLSWVEFNARVLGEALDSRLPILERLKFLCIVGSNFDEFFSVRVARLRQLGRDGDDYYGPSGLRASEQLAAIAGRAHELMDQAHQCFNEDVLPGLARAGLVIARPPQYAPADRQFVERFFDEAVFATLTPQAISLDVPLPLSGNLRIYAAFRLRREGEEDRHAVVQIPQNIPRFQLLPTAAEGTRRYALLEDLVLVGGPKLFPGYAIAESAIIHVTRDADVPVDEERDDDFIEAMAEVLAGRSSSPAVRMVISTTSKSLLEYLRRALDLAPNEVYRVAGPVSLRTFMPVCFFPGFDHLRQTPWTPAQPHEIPEDADLWDLLKERDVLLHHPYEAFEPVTRLLSQAAEDPAVLAIKMTLYRTGGNSPIVRALTRAAQNGKQVAVLVELKARFDEERNIEWARQLEQAGAIVIHGIAKLKVHAKAILIVRREPQGFVRYVHMGTGNYNEGTAGLYTDFSLFTARDEVASEVARFFNALTGYSSVPNLCLLAMAPYGLRQRLKQCIEREIARHTADNPGLIMIKTNSLSCPEMADALYRASQAGVKVLLNVRGLCCLRPGVKGLSENIRVVSIVGRYLEHARVYYFKNGSSDEEVYLASADLMPRNLDGRVELLFPVLAPEQRSHLVRVLKTFFHDNCKAHELQPDGRYRRVQGGSTPVNAQETFHREAVLAEEAGRLGQAKEFLVRRKHRPENGEA